MTNPNTTAADPVRPFRAPDDLWKPFVELARVAERLSGADVLRRLMQEFLDKYRVFWAPEHEAVDPTMPMIAWYECDECDDVHRLSGEHAPWGCSVVKALQDREAKAAS